MSDVAATTKVAKVSVVTKRDATARCTASAVHCQEKSRPGGWLHLAMWSPKTLSSMGDVSAAAPNDAVLQRGEFSMLDIMGAPKVRGGNNASRRVQLIPLSLGS
jgi:hypothetical protein